MKYRKVYKEEDYPLDMNPHHIRKMEKCESMLSNSKLGTTILSIVYLVSNLDYARYYDIYKLVFGKKRCPLKKNQNAKINYYIEILKGTIDLSYYDAKNKPVTEEIAGIINSSAKGIYVYNKNKLIDFFIQSMKFLSQDYLNKEYECIFKNKQVREIIYRYLINYSKNMDWKGNELVSVSDIVCNIESHLLVMFYEKKLGRNILINKWAMLIINEEKKKNLFE